MYLDTVNGVDIFHAVQDYPADLLQALIGTHDTNGASLYQDVALGQQLNSLHYMSDTTSRTSMTRTLSVLPSGPMILCLRFTKRSLFRTMLPILMMSHATASSNILTACPIATPRASSFIMSRAFKIMYGSYVFLVVRTDMEPWIRSREQAMPCERSEGRAKMMHWRAHVLPTPVLRHSILHAGISPGIWGIGWQKKTPP